MRVTEKFDFLRMFRGIGCIARKSWLQIFLFCWFFGASIFGVMLWQEQQQNSLLLFNLNSSIRDEFYSLYKENKKNSDLADNSSTIIASKMDAISLAIESLKMSISVLDLKVFALENKITSDHR